MVEAESLARARMDVSMYLLEVSDKKVAFDPRDF